MKALVVLGAPPLVEGQPQGRTSVGLIRGLQANGVDVRVCAARLPSAPPGEPPTDLPVTLIDVEPPVRGWGSRAAMLTNPLGHLARGVFADHVREEARSADLVHLEEVSTAAFARLLDMPSIVHLHYLVRKDRSPPPPWSKHVVHYTELVLAEARAARATRFLAASSPVVAAHLRRVAPKADLTLAPLSLDPSGYQPATLDGPPVAGMIGTAWWPPTRSAIDRLTGSLWPLVRARVPEARLRLAGRGLADLPLDRGDGVEILGEVDEAAAFLSELSLLLYPVRRGSGMKVKVLEAIASGLPVVTTPEGADGIGPHDGVIVETEDDRLAAAAAELLTDATARKQRGAAARRLFMERFAPAVATAPLVDAYERMLARTT